MGEFVLGALAGMSQGLNTLAAGMTRSAQQEEDQRLFEQRSAFLQRLQLDTQQRSMEQERAFKTSPESLQAISTLAEAQSKAAQAARLSTLQNEPLQAAEEKKIKRDALVKGEAEQAVKLSEYENTRLQTARRNNAIQDAIAQAKAQASAIVETASDPKVLDAYRRVAFANNPDLPARISLLGAQAAAAKEGAAHTAEVTAGLKFANDTARQVKALREALSASYGSGDQSDPKLMTWRANVGNMISDLTSSVGQEKWFNLIEKANDKIKGYLQVKTNPNTSPEEAQRIDGLIAQVEEQIKAILPRVGMDVKDPNRPASQEAANAIYAQRIKDMRKQYPRDKWDLGIATMNAQMRAWNYEVPQEGQAAKPGATGGPRRSDAPSYPMLSVTTSRLQALQERAKSGTLDAAGRAELSALLGQSTP